MSLAPEITVSRWFNTPEPLTLAGLRGRPVLLHAFQMLCPGCVSHGTPQTQRAFELFRNSDLQVIGLHTVFEHHAAMTPVSLEAPPSSMAFEGSSLRSLIGGQVGSKHT